jgi:hypothetical protein
MILLEFSFVPPSIHDSKSYLREIRKLPLVPSILPVIRSDTGEKRNERTEEMRSEKAHEAFT